MSEHKKRIHELLDRILETGDPFLFQLSVLDAAGEARCFQWGRGLRSEALYLALANARQLCPRLATEASLALIPELEERMRQIRHAAPKIISVGRAGNA